ncbi:MAG: PAN domain-containing protein [Oligoflexus sp.]
MSVKTFLRRVLLSLLFFFHTMLIASESMKEWEIKENCDIPSESISSKKMLSVLDCQKFCETEAKCRSFVFVSGWQRCFLKNQFAKQASIRFISADLPAAAKAEFSEASLHTDHDHSGKDLKRLVLEQAIECGRACQKQDDCNAFTFIDGYRVCWLKSAGGRLSKKIFYCGIPKSVGKN